MFEGFAQRGLRKRSRNGCRTCRKRHQKCDERKPTCLNCRLRGIECGGYGVTLTEFTSYSGLEGQMVSRVRRDSSDRSNTRRCDDDHIATRGASPGHDGHPVRQQQAEPLRVPADTVGTQLLNGPNRETFEPLDNLDLGRGSISPLDFSLLGDWSPSPLETRGAQAGPLDEEEEEEEHEQQLELAALSQPTRHHTIPTAPQDPFDQYLFTYFMDTLYLRLYPIKLEQNPYRVVYGSLATESEPLLKVIMLASALHLAKQGKLPGFAIEHYRAQVQDSFRTAIRKSDDTWSLGATVLLSVVFDIIGTSIDTWSSKLIGCRRLLEMAIRTWTGKPPVGLQCLLLQYNWAVTMGKAILKGTVAVDIINELKCIDEVHGSATDLDLRQHQSHWWDNLPDYTMHLLLREATEHALTVEALKAQLPETADGLLRLMPQVSDLVHRVETWQPATSTVRPEYVHSVTHFNAVWRAGMLCFIYSEIYSLGPRDVRMQGCVEAVLQPLGRLSWLQACLFPFFMIAVHAGTEEARGVFLAKLADMHGLLGFQGPLSVAGVLKCIWARSDSDAAGGRNGGRVEWRSVVRDMGMELNILL